MRGWVEGHTALSGSTLHMCLVVDSAPSERPESRLPAGEEDHSAQTGQEGT